MKVLYPLNKFYIDYVLSGCLGYIRLNKTLSES